MFILHPIFLFSIGTFIGLSPYIFASDYFYLYRAFSINEEILLVYLIGYISFVLGVKTIQFIYKKRVREFKFEKKDFNVIIYSLIFISLIIFIKIVAQYGSLPIISILLGDETIAFVNQTQKDVGGGLYGLFFLIIISLIVLFPYSIINKKITKSNTLLFWLHLLLLIIYTTYSGKRQMMFILFTYTFTYLLIFYYKNKDYEVLKKIKFVGIISLSILITIFVIIGLIRSTLSNEEVSLIGPIIHYASLPFINLTSIITYSESNTYAYSLTAFYETILSDLPTFIKGMFNLEYKTLNMPLIEPTSPPTIYGMVFWNFGYIGIIIHLFSIGSFVSYLYLKAIYSKSFLFISLYSLTVWPLVSIHTYNHFKNFMFFIIPLFIIIIGSYIYKKIPKKG